MNASNGEAEAPAPAGVGHSNTARLRLYALWAAWAGVAFFAVYPTMNALTARRESRLNLYHPAELAVPFVPQLIWAYLSMFVLFLLPLFLLPAARMPALGKQLVAGTIVSGIVFLLLPAELGFMRTIPSEPGYAQLYTALFGLDHPHNLVPSLHVVYSAAIALACAEVARPAVSALLYGWLALIIASTVLVHQHHILDAVAAIALVLLLRRRYGVTHA